MTESNDQAPEFASFNDDERDTEGHMRVMFQDDEQATGKDERDEQGDDTEGHRMT